MIIEILLIIIGAIWLGWKLREISAVRLYKQMKMEEQESRILELADKIQSTFIETNVEKIGDTFYLHDKATGEFLAQGDSSEELSTNLRTRFPEKRFVMDKKDLESIGIYDE